MRALTLQQGAVQLRSDYPAPIPRPGEALLRMRLAGICGTDLALTEGYKGGFEGVLGHEFVGEVLAAPGNEVWVGRRVVAEINTQCGHCARCRAGLATHCAERRVLGILHWDGAFADYLLAPIGNLYTLPDDLEDDRAVFVEPVAAAYAALHDLPSGCNPAAGSRVIVLGDGRLGQLIAQVFQAEGYAPLLVGRHPAKLAIAAACGLRTTLQAPVGGEYDIAIEATGRPEALALAIACLRPRGVLVLKSTAAHPALVDLAPIVVNEVRVIGSRCGPFPLAIEALRRGQVDPKPLIAARFPLVHGVEALAHARSAGVLKVLIEGK